MKNKKRIALAVAVMLAVTALPMTVFASKKDKEDEKLSKVTLTARIIVEAVDSGLVRRFPIPLEAVCIVRTVAAVLHQLSVRHPVGNENIISVRHITPKAGVIAPRLI